ncbi:hypothetical protein [Salarchaeum sp. JOR-1]|uniref:hypothetical protein n=1 Tax=Salarchaeum sp. JOR-1 TaxID=2599399 RepID=UPI001198951E|nr:hypothetical protein [Salarchaeum sp. JOR-1]QDX40846.1 hypothetical protein FQU85_08000 [Salarchaeum sp. JOR-1]
MKRRALLSSLAAGGVAAIAGCNGRTDGANGTTTHGDDSTRTTTSTANDAPTPPETGLADATTAVFETRDRTVSLLGGRRRLSSGVVMRAWLSATATADHPARVTATLRNDTEYESTLRLGDVPPFGATPHASPGRDYDHTLYLAPTEDHGFATTAPGVARAQSGGWYLDAAPDRWQPEAVDLAAGDTLVGEFAVVPREPGSIPTGRYAFGYADDPLTLSVWQTSKPGPAERSRFENATPPAFEKQSPQWYHGATPKTPTFLQPNTEQVDAPAPVSFTLYNHLTEPLSGNFYDWALYKQVDGEWYHIAPWAIPVPLTPLAPGDTHTWTLHAFNSPSVECEDAIALGYLGGGRYAFHVSMSSEDGPTHAALFDFDAPAVSVTPTDGVTTSRSDGVVTVTGPGRDADTGGDATLVVERAETADTRLIPEQVMRRRNRGLRNTLPFFESGVVRVELHTDDGTVDGIVGYDAGARTFRFDGEAFVARRA